MASAHILIIDDSHAALMLYQELLEPLKAQISLASDGEEGLALLRSHPCDLVITDVDMPKLNGIELCKRMRDDPRLTETPVIMASVFDTDKDIVRGFQAGASAYLSKMELRDYLLSTVRNVIWRSRHVRKRTILVVDDSRTILTLISEQLEANGFQAICAENGAEAIGVLSRASPDLILSDINMPVMDGFELCRVIKADRKWANVPFVVMSSSAEKAYMQRMLQYGAAAYLTKPFNLDQLIISIEKILSDHFLRLLSDRERLKQERAGLLQSIESLIAALEARDTYTRGHSDSVARISAEMATLSGASKSDIEQLVLGCRLHDIGKIGIRDEVLLKPGKLTPTEYEQIKQHPAIGRRIVESVPSFAPLLPIIYSHHERWDGNGYPEKLKGEQINRWARIAAVADTFDALVSDRPYRKGMPLEKAFAIIREVAGSQL
ncbi:MAG TPA: response regulator, partial [Motiliproteus sp.]